MDSELVLHKAPKGKYYMGVDCYSGICAFTVMRKDGEIMEYGKSMDKEVFEKEVERVARYYNIPKENILKECN